MAQTSKKITKTEIREKFVSEHFPIHVIGRHIEITDAMKSYAIDKLMRIEKFGDRVLDVMIVMDLQRGINKVDFLVNLNNKKIMASGQDRDMYASIDQAVEHLKNKLSRYHEKMHKLDRTKIGRTIHPGEKATNALDDINDQIEEAELDKIERELGPKPIVKRDKSALKMLREQEAALKMETLTDPCLLFRAEEDQKIKMIYRLDDGTLGMIEVLDE